LFYAYRLNIDVVSLPPPPPFGVLLLGQEENSMRHREPTVSEANLAAAPRCFSSCPRRSTPKGEVVGELSK